MAQKTRAELQAMVARRDADIAALYETIERNNEQSDLMMDRFMKLEAEVEKLQHIASHYAFTIERLDASLKESRRSFKVGIKALSQKSK